MAKLSSGKRCFNSQFLLKHSWWQEPSSTSGNWSILAFHLAACTCVKQHSCQARWEGVQATFCFLFTADSRVSRVFWAVSLSVGGAIRAMPVDRPTISTSSCKCSSNAEHSKRYLMRTACLLLSVMFDHLLQNTKSRRYTLQLTAVRATWPEVKPSVNMQLFCWDNDDCSSPQQCRI